MLKTLKILALFILTLLFVTEAHAAGVKSLRIGQGVGNVRIVLDADKDFPYKAFLLENPKRLVVDVKDVTVSKEIEKKQDNNFVSKIRTGNNGIDGTRIVFDLSKPAIIKKAFMLPPQSSFGWRFVIDLTLSTDREFSSRIGDKYAFSSDGMNGYKDLNPKSSTASNENKSAKRIIVLDPGHGGKDPGAIGYSGVYEKHIVLSFSKELKKELENAGYKVHLTRSTDIFIPLAERVKIARQYKPDLFLSIHADSAKNRNAKGLSVYTLSETASDKEAEALAERENKVDILAGINMVEHSKEVSDILINLAQRESMNRSSEFATFMVQEMRKTCALVDNTHRFAGFAVLKAPDVPSVLLEMGYLSNKVEEKNLRQPAHRKKLATAAKVSINKYFENMQRASLF